MKTHQCIIENGKKLNYQKKNKINECLFASGGKLTKEINLPIRKSGCAALDMAYVASGRYDGYIQDNLKLWDIAAGIIIIKEAGGIINDIDLNITKNIKVITSSPSINAKFIEKIE